MKANEMPERIYLFDYNDAMVTPLEGDTVYVREDAFIEKAVGRLKHYLDNCVRIANDVGVREKGAIIEDFRKYIEGEEA